MSDARKPFPFREFEPKWQARWDTEKTFRTPGPGDADFDPAKPKYYVLDMFPYPSGAGLHVGHPEGYTATDIIGRYKRMTGHNVLHPMGYDSFGLPAEQYAIKTGQHPAITTAANIETFRRQLKSLGFGYDWDREIATTDPEYVRWTQWIFLQIYNSYFCEETNKARPVSELEAKGWTRDQIDEVRLAFVADTPVWWSPDLGTVLANEEVEEWKSKGHTVERRPLRQWMLRITKYAQRLIDELDTLDWPEGIKLLQKNWIGRSEGAEVAFDVQGHTVTVFTTRPDTLFGATYMVLAPEHPLVPGNHHRGATRHPSRPIRKPSPPSPTWTAAISTRTSPASSPAPSPSIRSTTIEIPVWIADYVMMGYGTGAIMAVPAHDERDFEFAKKFKLPIIQVLVPADALRDKNLNSLLNAPGSETIVNDCGYWKEQDVWVATGIEQAYAEHGIAINSGFLDGLPTAEAKAKMIDWLESNGKGKRRIQYKLRDWLFSRQRYWGEPFPIIWKDGHHHAISESELPLLAPPLEDYKPSGTPDPLLSKATEWVNLPDGFTRETNTMPQWAGSCWYYLRYCDPRNNSRLHLKRSGRLLVRSKQGRSIFTSAARSTRFFTFSMPASGIRSSSISATSAPPEPFNRSFQPRPHPRRGRTEDVQVPRQRRQPRRRRFRIRSRRAAPLRNVHGPARTGETLADEGRRGRFPFPRPRLARRHGGTTGRHASPFPRRSRTSHALTKSCSGSCTRPSRRSARTSRNSASTPPSRR